MSCNSCNQPTCTEPNRCYEARLSLGLNDAKTMIVGKLDGVPIIPINLREAMRANETNTSLKYDEESKSLVFENEKFENGKGVADYVPVSEIFSGADLSQLGGVDSLVEGGLASVIAVDGKLRLVFDVPEPVQVGEVSEGFITYVPDPIAGSRYKTIKPAPGGTSDSLLVGHPNGSVEFAVPIVSPLLVPLQSLTGQGKFSGAPATAHGNWRYQSMGTTDVVTNTSGSQIEVTLSFRYSLQSAATRNGVYCRLVNGGADYKTTFVEGVTSLKQEGYPGGFGQFTVVLAPNQKCQFEFGAWEDGTGNMTITIGSTDEDGSGNSVETAYPPVITLRRQI